MERVGVGLSSTVKDDASYPRSRQRKKKKRHKETRRTVVTACSQPCKSEMRMRSKEIGKLKSHQSRERCRRVIWNDARRDRWAATPRRGPHFGQGDADVAGFCIHIYISIQNIDNAYACITSRPFFVKSRFSQRLSVSVFVFGLFSTSPCLISRLLARLHPASAGRLQKSRSPAIVHNSLEHVLLDFCKFQDNVGSERS